MKLKIVLMIGLFSLLLSACNTTYDQGALPVEEPPSAIMNKPGGVHLTMESPSQNVTIHAQRMHDLRTVLSHDELQMVEWVNVERRRQGLKALKVNPKLVLLARMKALEMIQDDVLSHRSPRFGSVLTMVNQAGVNFKTVGENIASNFTLDGAHNSLMNSPSHRANLLNPQYDEIGIGLNRGGENGYVFVQLFVGH